MIDYITLGTNDLARAGRFYDALLALFGARRTWESDHHVGWGTAPGSTMLVVIKPFDGKPATAGNGTMVSLRAGSREQVDAVYQKALALGGKDEGAAGPRRGTFYGGYFRDLDGNKFVVGYNG